jgi:ribosomal protein L11 methyltransferase
LKTYPAVDVQFAPADLVLALVDEFGPAAVEEHDDILRIFFSDVRARDAAAAALGAEFDIACVDVVDEDWARRSQENLTPITVGAITIVANPQPRTPNPQPLIPNPYTHTITIQPSMGFGTGHHATTRLCLAALQEIDLSGRFVLDVGTGSGVLAIAASRLGAARALGIDSDEDAIHAARENLTLNPEARHILLEVADLTDGLVANVDVLTANLTGALLVRAAALLLDAVRPGGSLILSGLLAHERGEVIRAFAPAAPTSEREEDGWVGLTMKKP